MTHLLGIDPGFAAFGIAIYDVSNESVPLLDVIRTEKSTKKRKVLASDDNVRRSREICNALSALRAEYDIVAICAEAMSFPRNSSSAAKVAMAWGVIVSFAELNALPIVQASPQEIKKTICGHHSASKEEVEDALQTRYHQAKVDAGVPPSFHNHAWDALSAIVAGLNSDVVRLVVKMDGGSTRRTMG